MARRIDYDSIGQEQPAEQWSARDHVLAVLHRAGLSMAPAPMPHSLDQAASWWLTHMCERKGAKEDERQYGQRCAFSLNGWLQLSEQNRQMVCKLAAEAPYRGERFDAYLAIVDETETMREVGLAEYRKLSITKLRSMLNNFGR